MKKRTKKNLMILGIFSIILVVGAIFVVKFFGGYSTVAGKLMNSSDTITFQGDSIQDYVHIMLKSSDEINVVDGIEYVVKDPNGEEVAKGKLEEDKIVRHKFENISGEWKVELNFEEGEESMIDYGYEISSKNESTMRTE